MKEDYLWDKTGDDPEIKRLEGVLVIFQYQKTAAPVLPAAKAIPFADEAPRRKFSLAFAFAACLTTVVLLGVWFQMSSDKIGPDKDSVLTQSQIGSQTPDEPLVNRIDGFQIERAKQPAKRDRLIVRQSATLINRRNKTITRSSENKKPAVGLTSEEKYAYEQLMLALSITTSKLKIVQDRINGIEDGQTDRTKNDR